MRYPIIITNPSLARRPKDEIAIPAAGIKLVRGNGIEIESVQIKAKNAKNFSP